MTETHILNVSAIDGLSFVSRTGEAPGSLKLWNIAEPSDYSTACVVGRAAAAELIEFMRTKDNPAVFGSIAQAIGQGGRYGGVEIGFYSGIAEATTAYG